MKNTKKFNELIKELDILNKQKALKQVNDVEASKRQLEIFKELKANHWKEIPKLQRISISMAIPVLDKSIKEYDKLVNLNAKAQVSINNGKEKINKWFKFKKKK